MKSLTSLLLIGISGIILSSCKADTSENTKDNHAVQPPSANQNDNSQNSLDWSGTYKGILPCADCEGTDSEIKLTKDLKYVFKYKYIGKSEEFITESGNLTWDASGSSIVLQGPKGSTKYKVGENKLYLLDESGNIISGDLSDKYVLLKQAGSVTDVKWVLIELYGKPISPGNGLNIAPYFTLNTVKNKVLGNSGCNSIGGAFILEGTNGIKMTNIFATMASCGDTDSENLFQRALRNAQSYDLQGDELTLSEPEWAVSARLVKE